MGVGARKPDGLSMFHWVNTVLGWNGYIMLSLIDPYGIPLDLS
jgi:hypothetical protein